MLAIFTLLRFIVPLLVLVVLVSLIAPWFWRRKRRKSDRIEVEATVVRSEPHGTSPDDWK